MVFNVAFNNISVTSWWGFIIESKEQLLKTKIEIRGFEIVRLTEQLLNCEVTK
jgi:hypothetical protein